LPIPSFIRTLVRRTAANPEMWNLFRRLLEDNFKGEKATIRRELFHHRPRIRPRLLDVGCGTGELTDLFVLAGYEYHGVDILDSFINYALQRHAGSNAKFATMDATQMSFADATFDNVLVTGVIHHMTDEAARAVLCEMRRVLRPGGRVLIMEDTAVGYKLNLLGALIHLLDQGAYIRTADQYRQLFAGIFKVCKEYKIISGVCDYQVFVLEK
jgi:ubiquinone/menaquinone biosynthesis C-methylase UbiE